MDAGADIPWSMIEFPTEGDFLRAKAAGYLESWTLRSSRSFTFARRRLYDEYGVYNSVYGILMELQCQDFRGQRGPDLDCRPV